MNHCNMSLFIVYVVRARGASYIQYDRTLYIDARVSGKGQHPVIYPGYKLTSLINWSIYCYSFIVIMDRPEGRIHSNDRR